MCSSGLDASEFVPLTIAGTFLDASRLDAFMLLRLVQVRSNVPAIENSIAILLFLQGRLWKVGVKYRPGDNTPASRCLPSRWLVKVTGCPSPPSRSNRRGLWVLGRRTACRAGARAHREADVQQRAQKGESRVYFPTLHV